MRFNNFELCSITVLFLHISLEKFKWWIWLLQGVLRYWLLRGEIKISYKLWKKGRAYLVNKALQNLKHILCILDD